MVKISVVLPIYNAEAYLRESIDSILSQTFSEFELLLIDDGSTDNSRNIIDSYNDPRIRFEPNSHNEGIVASLNKGLALAKGEYVAIMHADDVSLPHRLEVQALFLDTHPEVAAVAARTSLIDSTGSEVGFWPADQTAIGFDQIRNMLPRNNCISHPSVMIRKTIAITYRYQQLRATEDYDLWLRLVADNRRIEKIDEILLKYRVHGASVTAGTRSDEYKEMRTKAGFLAKSFCRGRMTTFHREVLKRLTGDFSRVNYCILKADVLTVLRGFFVSLGMLFGLICSRFLKSPPGVFYFFPFPFNHIGGSERIHADLVESNLKSNQWVIIANRWQKPTAVAAHGMPCRIIDISGLLCNPFSRNFTVGFFAALINRMANAVCGANCEFFYWLLPYLKQRISCVDIIHAYDVFMNELSLPHLGRINRRLVFSSELRKDLQSVYRKKEIPASLTERIFLVNYGVEVPDDVPPRLPEAQLEIIFVGRGSAEKRVHLVGRIAALLAASRLPVEVSLVGDVCEFVDEADRPYCNFLGEIHDRQVINDLYRKADILLITSRSEGVSLVKMEAMAYGVVPVAVAVGGVPEHIIHGETGYLVNPDQDEDGIVIDCCDIIRDVMKCRGRLREVSLRAHAFARANFDRSRAISEFSKVLEFGS